MRILKPHMEILPPAQRSLWLELAPARTFDMVLYGGTAIALHLGHRSSIDFDFFTHRHLDKIALRDGFSFMKNSSVLQDAPDAFSMSVPSSTGDPVMISFFGGIDIGRVDEPWSTEDGILQVASLDDLMALKAKVLLQRIVAKDYQDIAAMVKAGVSLAKGIASAKLMYGGGFQPSECLKALVFFEGGDLTTLSVETKDTLITSVKSIGDLPPAKIIDNRLSGR
jgi:Nucleotidyl transferase AbiEii toxin, Type IV TA system